MDNIEIPPSSFTAHYPGIVNVLRSEVKIAPAFDPREISTVPEHIKFEAIWDTGATNSLITKNVVEQCGLETIGLIKVSTPNGPSLQNAYMINMFLRNNVGVAMVRVTEGQLSDGADVLIGMDIISKGDFAVCNKDGCTTLSFRIPSMECIDFAKPPQPVHIPPEPGRNDPCPCGSGKKYKHCHGKK